MSYYIDIQNATNEPLPVSEEALTRLASLALRDYQKEAELTVRLVTAEEMLHLNNTYRKQIKRLMYWHFLVLYHLKFN